MCTVEAARCLRMVNALVCTHYIYNDTVLCMYNGVMYV